MNAFRIASLAILTVCLFAAFDFVSTGFWIFPFPIYKTGLFFMVLAILISEKKMPQLTGFLSLGWSFALMLSSGFFLQTFVSGLKFEKLREGMFISYALIAFLLLFAIWAVMFSLKHSQKTLRLISLFLALSFFICLALNLYGFAIIPLLLWTTAMFLSKNYKSSEYAILVLIVFVYASSWIMGYYASKEIEGTAIQATGSDFILFSM